MPGQDGWVVVGVDNGGTANNGTVLDADGRFLIDRMAEIPSYVREGPDKAVQALVDSVEHVLGLVGLPRSAVRAVGLDTPGPASATGVLSSRGATNFANPEWWGFDIRGAMEDRLGLPVVYNNDGNAAALYAHHTQYSAESGQHSSVAAIVGTGLGGGVVEGGRVISGAAGMAGELGHVPIPMAGLLEDAQPLPSVQLRPAGRRGKRGLTDRDREEPAAVLADPLRRGTNSAVGFRSARPRSWSGATGKTPTNSR